MVGRSIACYEANSICTNGATRIDVRYHFVGVEGRILRAESEKQAVDGSTNKLPEATLVHHTGRRY